MDIKVFYSKNKDVINVFGVALGAILVFVIGRNIQKSIRKKKQESSPIPAVIYNDPMDIEVPVTIENPTGVLIEDKPIDAVKCSTIITDNDGDYDYIKCSHVWYTRSKKMPKTLSSQNSFPNWTSLRNNNKAIDLLNKKYPNY